ncbi:hypothetical protein VULLAG_LOCUS1028 [Vulpes lagopus]
MQQSDQADVGQPDAPAIHHSSVGVYFAVCHPHIHPAGFTSRSDFERCSSAGPGKRTDALNVPMVSQFRFNLVGYRSSFSRGPPVPAHVGSCCFWLCPRPLHSIHVASSACTSY